MTHEELLREARAAASAEELLATAKENGVPLDVEGAAAYYALLNQQGELTDEELENVAGGGCHHDGKLVVTVGYTCDNWTCESCNDNKSMWDQEHGRQHRCSADKKVKLCDCNHCSYCKYEKGLWLCYHPAKRE